MGLSPKVGRHVRLVIYQDRRNISPRDFKSRHSRNAERLVREIGAIKNRLTCDLMGLSPKVGRHVRLVIYQGRRNISLRDFKSRHLWNAEQLDREIGATKTV